MTCTFFGHRDCPDSVFESLKRTVIELIEDKGVCRFLVGNNGRFDSYVLHTLKALKCDYPHIDYCVVLAYLPQKLDFDYPTLYPEGIEQVPKRFAISYRNKFMISQSNFVVAYVAHPTGGAHKFFTEGKRLGKICINLYREESGNETE